MSESTGTAGSRLAAAASAGSQSVTPATLREWDNTHLWHPFAPMSAFREENVPIIARGEGFDLIDVENRRYLDGISSLWCNVHGHTVPEINRALHDQIDAIAHTTLLGLASEPSIRFAKAWPRSLRRVSTRSSTRTAEQPV